MTELQKIVSDEAVEREFKNTNFGSRKPREVIADTLLKYACGFRSGFTARTILANLGLLTVRQKSTTVSRMGKNYLYEAFKRID